MADENKFGLGRIPAFDPRDAGFMMLKLSVQKVGRRHFHVVTAKAMDQGSQPACVGYAGEQYLRSSPTKNLPFKSAFDLYKECQNYDEWHGNDYAGTSVRALFKVLKMRGYVSEYLWAFNAETVIAHVLAGQPMVLGTVWDEKMFSPFEFGKKKDVFISRGGRVVGGHAYFLCGINLDMRCPDGSIGAARLINSWSREWGYKGRAWISLNHLDSLIRDFGEACMAKELKFREQI